MTTPTLLTLSEAAEVLGISLPTARRWTSEGRLGCLRNGRWIRVTPEHIEAFMTSSEQPAEGGPKASRQHTGNSATKKREFRIQPMRGRK